MRVYSKQECGGNLHHDFKIIILTGQILFFFKGVLHITLSEKDCFCFCYFALEITIFKLQTNLYIIAFAFDAQQNMLIRIRKMNSM